MSNRPVGENNTGIFTLLFRETGLFFEQAWKWTEEQAREDRLLIADDDRRRLTDAETRKAEAEARLLEQIRLAKQAGLDVDAIMRRVKG
ncbi:hypothetical protein EYB53_008000 [Candidatus Chloroploca sp. M-50]|uniref:Uncharacterized protein n=1 Tax=Candidatus Chloroploca mongolica TaxID=2528176 RepID=A0ABS4D883_9CHLR|nr:hypothetical protein [Candidatus Chloroploca mongolica]MBP1465646.1 hypothetical protein [Candidatus Chloroploca mongolica]